MLLRVRLRAKEPLLFSAPDGRADGATRRDPQRLQDAHRLDQLGHGIRIVARAGGGVPRVDVRAQEHDLVADARIRTGKLGDDVVPVGVGRVVTRLHVGPKLHRRAALECAHQQVVVLRGDDHRGHRVVGRAGARSEHEHRSVVAFAGSQHNASMQIMQRRLKRTTTERASRDVGARCADGNRLLVLHGLEPILRDERVLRLRREHHGASQRRRSCLHRVGVREVTDVDRRRDDLAGRGRAPRLGIGNEREVARLRHLQRELLEGPAPSERPRLRMDARESVPRQRGR